MEETPDVICGSPGACSGADESTCSRTSLTVIDRYTQDYIGTYLLKYLDTNSHCMLLRSICDLKPSI